MEVLVGGAVIGLGYLFSKEGIRNNTKFSDKVKVIKFQMEILFINQIEVMTFGRKNKKMLKNYLKKLKIRQKQML